MYFRQFDSTFLTTSYLRIVLIYRKLLISLALSATSAGLLAAQRDDSLTVARRVVAATSLASKEYANGVSAGGGRVVAGQEVEEAKLFLDAARLDGPSLPTAVRQVADAELLALRAMLDRVAPPDSVAARAAALEPRATRAR